MVLSVNYHLINTSLLANNSYYTTRITSQCSNHLPRTGDLLKYVSDVDLSLGVMCLVMTILLLVLYAEEVVMLKTTYTDKEERLKVMCLLGIYPVFSCCALAGLFVPRSFPMTEFLSTFYLSVAMFIFQRMIVLFIAGESNLVRVFHDSHLPLAVPPLCCICACICKHFPVKVSTKSIITARLFVLQGALIRPILSFSFGIYYLNTTYEGTSVPLVTAINIMKGLSMMLAMYGLQIIYRLTRDHLQNDLGHQRILGKFICFQLVILFGIFQPNIFHFLQLGNLPKCSPPFGSRVMSLRYNNMVQVIEMFVIAIVARYIYHQTRRNNEPQLEIARPKNNYSISNGKCYTADNQAFTDSTDNLQQEVENADNLEDDS